MFRKLITILLLSGILYSMGNTPNYDNRYDSEIEKQANISIGDRVSSISNQELGESITESIVAKDRAVDGDIFSLKLESLVFQEKLVKNPFGKEENKNVPVKEVLRGAKVVYINRIISSSDDVKTNIVVKNSIPEGTKYIRGSAICEKGCTLRYSIDGGETFTDSDSDDYIYNYIEFHFKNIFPNKEARMGFRAIVE